MSLVRYVQARKRALFDALLEGWLAEGGKLGELAEAVGRAADGLERVAAGAEGLEVERRYLLSSLPGRCVGEAATEIDQGWLPGAVLQERVRRTRHPDGSERYLRTVKAGRGLARFELEEACDEGLFRALWPLTEGCRVRKRRYAVPEGVRVWEIDAFQDRALVLAEIELPSPEAAIELPEWLAPHVLREVPGDPAYVNRNLAR